MKHPIKFVLVALTLAIAIPVSQAQTPGTPPTPPPPPAGEHLKKHDGPRGDRLKHLSEKLGLTEDQKTKLKPIIKEEGQAIKAVRDDASLAKDAKWAKIEGIRKSYHEQIRALLTPEQATKFDEFREERGHGPGNREGAGPKK